MPVVERCDDDGDQLGDERARVLEYLDAEIAGIREEQSRTGWTQFGLVSAIAAMALLAIDLWVSTTHPLVHAGAVLVAASLLVNVIELIGSGAAMFGSEGGSAPKFRAVRSIAPAVSETTARLVRALVVASVALAVRSEDAWLPAWVVGATTLAPLALAPSAWWMARCDPDAVSSTGHRFRLGLRVLVLWIPLISMLFVTADMALPLVLATRAEVGAALKLGGLTAAGLYVWVRLQAGTRTTDLARSLTILRRDVGLGRATPAAALRDAELAVAGLDAATAFGPRVTRIVQRRDAMSAAVARLAAQISIYAPSRNPLAQPGSIPLKLAAEAEAEVAHLWAQLSALRKDVLSVAGPIVVSRWMAGEPKPKQHPLVDQVERIADDAAELVDAVDELVVEAMDTAEREAALSGSALSPGEPVA